MTYDHYIERPRKKKGAMAALLWNLRCIEGYLAVIDAMPNDFEDWNVRERSEIIKDVMRRTYELGFTDKNKSNLYREPLPDLRRVMEHAIPVSQWAELYLTAPQEFRQAIYFMAWCGPIANISVDSNAILNKNGEAYFNKTPHMPFARYARAGIDVRHEVDKQNVADVSLRAHYDQMNRITFMQPVFQYVKASMSFEAAFAWLEERYSAPSTAIAA